MATNTNQSGGKALKNKPRLSFWEIWNMSFGFLGIQFGFALQNANVSRIFETLGANVEDIPILWIAAPVTGLIIQPIIGYFSDRTWGRLGRRRPFFLAGAILASIALIIMPNSPVLWVAAGMLWIMDASINVSMEPFRAFVGDNLPSEQRTTGFAMQSFFIGIGAVVASMLPYIFTNWFGVSNEAVEGTIPISVKWSFYIGAIVFFLAVLWTVVRSKEYSPEEMASFKDAQESETFKKEMQTPEEFAANGKRQFNFGIIFLLVGVLLSYLLSLQNWDKQLYVLTFGIAAVGVLLILSGRMQQSGNYKNDYVTIVNDFQDMPKTMKQLAWVQFFSWFALFAMWIYTTAGVTSTKYDMDLDSQSVTSMLSYLPEDDSSLENAASIREELLEYQNTLSEGASTATASMKVVKYFLDENNREILKPGEAVITKLQSIEKEYNEGADWVGVCFAVYNGFAALFAFLIMYIAKKTSRKMTHAICLVIGGLCFVSIFFIGSPKLLLVPFVGIGLVWASILAMPYAILTGSLPASKMGYYMGVFNFFIVIPQIVAAAILGFLIGKLFAGEAIYALIIGGVSMVLAAVLTLRVDDKDDEVAVQAG